MHGSRGASSLWRQSRRPLCCGAYGAFVMEPCLHVCTDHIVHVPNLRVFVSRLEADAQVLQPLTAAAAVTRTHGMYANELRRLVRWQRVCCGSRVAPARVMLAGSYSSLPVLQTSGYPKSQQCCDSSSGAFVMVTCLLTAHRQRSREVLLGPSCHHA